MRSLDCDKPTCSTFIAKNKAAYKTQLLSNLVSSQSPEANCEDFTENALISFKNFFTCNQDQTNSHELAVNLPLKTNKELDKTTEHLKTVIHTYIAGFIVKKTKPRYFQKL